MYKIEDIINKVHCADCLEKLKELPENSVDSIVTDPPYELGFMGKSWDNTGIANNVEMWKECLRVLKPGGHLLSFGGTRTYHRMAVAIEDAGFEVRDMIEWVYGSGFPKSLNIGKAVDKLQGNERIPTGEIKHHAQKGVAIAEERGAVGGGAFGQAKDEEITKGTSEWEGWGTALKPAHEPICMARKPLGEKTVAENVLKHGTGGINIDESRVGTDVHKVNINDFSNQHGNKFGNNMPIAKLGEREVTGRFPANLIHDNSEEVKECFPNVGKGNGKGAYNYAGREYDNKGNSMFNGDKPQAPSNFNDSGNASRFFKSIKTDKLCTLCCLPFDIKHDTMSVCKNTNVNNAENSLKTTQATTEVIAPQNATTPDSKKFVQSVRSAGNLCDLCGTYIAHVLVGGKQAHQEESAPGQVFITEQKKQILDNVLASFVELRGKKDTTPTMNDLNLLFGFVFSAIENSTTYSDKESEVAKNHEWKSLLYTAKASKSERNKGCEGLEEKQTMGGGGFTSPQNEEGDYIVSGDKGTAGKYGSIKAKATNNHPTVKPITLMSYLIKMVTPKGGTVLDPFAGSGSTLVAAKQLKRNFIGVEISPEYCEIANKRLAQSILL